MKQVMCLLTSILFSLMALGQQDTVFIKYNLDNIPDKLNYKTDTMYFDTPMRRHILAGTTILPSTHHQQIAKGMGLYLSKVEKTDCQRDATVEFIPDKINSISNTDLALTIDINISDNCCYSFLCDIAIVNDSIINLIFYGYGTYCACDCCFGLTYHMDKENSPEFKKIKSVMINGNPKTLKPLK